VNWLTINVMKRLRKKRTPKKNQIPKKIRTEEFETASKPLETICILLTWRRKNAEARPKVTTSG
jgi:hypothetical protein